MVPVISQKWYFICRFASCWMIDAVTRVILQGSVNWHLLQHVLESRCVSSTSHFNESGLICHLNCNCNHSNCGSVLCVFNRPNENVRSLCFFFFFFIKRMSIVLYCWCEGKNNTLPRLLQLFPSIPGKLLNGAADVVKVSKHFPRLKKFDCSSLRNRNFISYCIRVHVRTHTHTHTHTHTTNDCQQIQFSQTVIHR